MVKNYNFKIECVLPISYQKFQKTLTYQNKIQILYFKNTTNICKYEHQMFF